MRQRLHCAARLPVNPAEQPIRRNLASALVKLGHHEESAAELQRLVEA